MLARIPLPARSAAWLLACIAALSLQSPLHAQETPAALAMAFQSDVRPLLKRYCYDCHGRTEPEGKLDLAAYASAADVVRDARSHEAWQAIGRRLKAKEMPPADASPQQSAAERQKIIAWITAQRSDFAERYAGDPGIVPVRRLSNAEYNHTIRDLTGVDLRPAREFPVDPATAAGFDNSAEALTMSPALMQKYLAAARHVAEHLVLKPEGFAFAPHPVMTDTDRDKYCVKRIVDFYARQPTNLADYFYAAWRYQHRAALGKSDATLAEVAVESKVSPKYLATIAQVFAEEHESGPLARLLAMWRALPAPTNADAAGKAEAEVRSACAAMRDFVRQVRGKLEPKPQDLDVSGIHKGAQPFVLWKNDQYAAGRRTFHLDALHVADAGAAAAAADDPEFGLLTLPADRTERTRYVASLARFCSVFPDAFYISERGRDYVGKPREAQEKGRLLSAGFHSMMGYYRDDAPLVELVLSPAEQRELDALWQELDFVTAAPLRQYTGFVWFERTDSRFMRDEEFDFARAEDKNVTSQAMIERLAEVYLAKAKRNGATEVPVKAIENYFQNINRAIRWVELTRLAAEPSHLAALLDFAERAYRRPLAAAERNDLLAFYRELRERDGASHEEALQDALVSVLLSPSFCYRTDLLAHDSEPRPLTDFDLASRLSYFLWASMPDAELLSHARSGDLHQPQVLTAQARRMLADDRSHGLATEFAGNWLDFRRFDQHNSVDRERFPSFTKELRHAMFEEPLRLFLDTAQHDRSVLDLLLGRTTFVNPVLARHYGIPFAGNNLPGPDEWARIEDATPYGRGGLLPMAVFLTQNSPGLRTSPVKRGYWVARRILGEQIPPPPPDVPEIPADETKLDLSLRETLARHRAHASCAGCHERFDFLGVVFEGYGPIGERRDRDLAGRPVEVQAAFPGGGEGAGLDGLRTYLRDTRQAEFLDNLCQKLLSYALGRTLLPSDDRLVHDMRRTLAENGYRFGPLVDEIITSRPFLTKRGQSPLAKD